MQQVFLMKSWLQPHLFKQPNLTADCPGLNSRGFYFNVPLSHLKNFLNDITFNYQCC